MKIAMSDAATRERTAKQHWAVPGSTHDRIVRWSKIGLPSAVGVLIAVLTLAPLDKHGDVSFILDKKKVASAPERMRVEEARYVGTDDKGQKFVMTAQRALQRSSEVPLVDIQGMFAELALARGPLKIAANQGRYNLDTQKVAIDGPVQVAGPDGYQLATRDVIVDLKQRQLASEGPVSGRMRLGQFQAGQLHANLGERTVVLDGGARLKIVQGAVR
jgi:lipopolysaccharide export system protein LptC